MPGRLWLFTLLYSLSLQISAQSNSAQLPCASNSERPSIGLVLGGGGARGLAHVGVIRQLEAMRIPIDCVVGTSMGAVVGGLYAAGIPSAELEKIALELNWASLFSDDVDRNDASFRRKRDDDLALLSVKAGIKKTGIALGAGVLTGQRALLTLERLLVSVSSVNDFYRLPIPFRAVAADLNTGQAVPLSKGRLPLALRASMSIPAVFIPVEIDGRLLIDGGVANQVPIDIAREMGAEIIIAVDVGTPLDILDADADALEITAQLTSMLTVSNAQRQIDTLTPQDVLLNPMESVVLLTVDFEQIPLSIEKGRNAVLAQASKLQIHAQEAAAFEKVIAARSRTSKKSPSIDFIRLKNQSQYADSKIEQILADKRPPKTIVELEKGIARIYSLGTLETVSYQLVEESEQTGALIHIVPKRRGPNYLESGLNLSSDFDGDLIGNLVVGVLRAPLNELGGEARGLIQIGSEPAIIAELYQPLPVEADYIAHIRLASEAPRINVFDDNGHKLARYDVKQFGVTAAIGKEFGSHRAVNLAVRRATGAARIGIGDPNLGDIDFDSADLSLSFQLDTADSVFFPREGSFGTVRLLTSSETLGADASFKQFGLDYFGAHKLQQHALQYGLRYHDTFSGIAPIQSVYRAGGFSRLAGYQANELSGQQFAMLFGGYLYEFGTLLDRPAFFGGSLELGNTWDSRGDISFETATLNGSVYVGFDSWLGPLLFGWGFREGGESSLFLSLGRPL